MRYQIAICDDEQADISYIEQQVLAWAGKQNLEVQIQSFLSAEAFLFAYEEKKDFDILLLDIEMIRIPFFEIRYLEVMKNYVTIHAKQEYVVKKTLGEFEKELDERFFRLGRSWLINLKMVRRVTKTEVHLADGSIIPLPRGQYDAINRAIIAGD